MLQDCEIAIEEHPSDFATILQHQAKRPSAVTNHVKLTHDSYLPRGWGLSAELLRILGYGVIQNCVCASSSYTLQTHFPDLASK
jgi:hypothetical protein